MENSESISRHQCQRREDDRGWWYNLINWWILPIHLTLAALFTLIALKVLQGRSFIVAGSGYRGHDSSMITLSQADVNTLISLALTAIRTLAGCWLTLTSWRMAFISLEQNGATLNEISHMISYRIPPLRFWGRGKCDSRGSLLSMWAIFFLALPTQFVAAIFNGAINWIPSTAYVQSDSPISVTTASSVAPQWTAHNDWLNNRYYEALSASGLASLASPESFVSNTSTRSVYRAPSRRFIPSIIGTPINSTLGNVTLPYFEIHSLDWITSANELEDEEKKQLESVVSEHDITAFTYGGHLQSDDRSEFSNPFSLGTDTARLILVNDVTWARAPFNNRTQNYEYPSPTIDTSQKWVVVASQFAQNCSSSSPDFGDISKIYQYSSPKASGCFHFARINYTAAAMICKECRIVSNGVVEAASETRDPSAWVPIPDPLVTNAISMIPEVLFYTKISNSSQAPTWQNIDGYTCGMIATAYQASWNSLTNQWRGSPMEITNISNPHAVLIAQVNEPRIALWFGLNAVLPISGVLLALLQKRCQHKAVRDPSTAALLLDTTALLDQDTTGLCNAATLRKGDKSLRLRLQMPDHGGLYNHPRIKVENLDQLPHYESRRKEWKKHAPKDETELDDLDVLL